MFHYAQPDKMEENTKSRLLLFLKHLGIGQGKFENYAGLSNGYINNLKGNIGSKQLQKICDAYPELNSVWLVTGKGVMLNNEDPERTEKKIEITENVIKIGKYEGALVYDIDGTCGTSPRSMEFTQENIIGSVNLPEINPHSPIIRANGDSMEPVIFDGDRIAIREIVNKEDIFYGQIYLVLTEEYRMIKYIRKCKEDENFVILKSRNPEYDDIRIQKDKIKKLFIVENILAIKTRV